MLTRGLEEEGYGVDVVDDGPEAVAMAIAHAYAAIVLDVTLPGLDGLQVAQRIRAERCWSPILMLTGRASVPDRVAGLDAGADDYLSKPFSFAELAARLRALVRRSRFEQPGPLVVGDLRLDPATRTAWRGAAELQLSPKEFALLELFLRNPGVVLTRSRILGTVWDHAETGSSNVVDQYIAYLRRKVDRPFARNDIETLRGVGYRLRNPAADGEGHTNGERRVPDRSTARRAGRRAATTGQLHPLHIDRTDT